MRANFKRATRRHVDEIIVVLLTTLFITAFFLFDCVRGSGRSDSRSFDATFGSMMRGFTISDALPTESGKTPYSLDSLQQGTQTIVVAGRTKIVSVSRSLPILISGWAVDGTAHSDASAVFLQVDDQRFPAIYGLERRDVEAALHINARNCGFVIPIDANVLLPGLHRVSISVVDAAETAQFRMSSGLSMRITN